MPELSPVTAPDGVLVCRVDPVTGERIAVVPATCRRGLHRLTPGVSPMVASGDHLSVTCAQCDPISGQAAMWLLSIPRPHPFSAELDDTPYLGQHRPVRRRP